MPRSPRILMCPPAHFSVDYVINPWMEGNLHSTDPARARRNPVALPCPSTMPSPSPATR